MPRLASALAALAAAAAAQSHPADVDDPRRQLDFWIGRWRTEAVERFDRTQGEWMTDGELDLQVLPILGGRAIVEYTRGRIGPCPSEGFSVRAWDEQAQEWVLVLNWPRPQQPRFYTLRGRFAFGRGEFVTAERERPDGTTVRERYTFSDITPGRFRWDSATSPDGRAWTTGLVSHGRRTAADPPEHPGMGTSRAWGRGAEHRSLDALLGEWQGVRRSTAADGTPREEPMTMRTETILQGAAQVRLLAVGDDYQGFAVQCFEPGRGRWVRWYLNNVHARFARYEGEVDAARSIWHPRPEGGGDAGAPRRRLTTEVTGPSSLRRTMELSDDGESWRTLWQDELQRKR